MNVDEIYASIRDEMAKFLDRFILEGGLNIQPGLVLFENDLMRGVLLWVSDRGDMLIDAQILKKCPVASVRFKVDMFNMLVIEKDRTMRNCDSCRYGLGGGYDNCKINLEDECAAGNYEAWEAKEECT